MSIRGDVDSIPTEPWGMRLLALCALVMIIGACVESYGITRWPMADDEVPTLVEMGLLDVPAQAFSVPTGQIGKLPRAVPVFYAVQRTLLRVLPGSGDVRYRIPSVIFGVLTSGLTFLVAARLRGLRFAFAFALVLHTSQLFVLVSQVDRFYALALLLFFASLTVLWLPMRAVTGIVAAAVLSALTVLTHNVTVAAFGLTFMAAAPLALVGRVPRHVAIRAGTAAAVAAGLYLFYLRPIVQGWNSTGNPTPVLISFTAHAGVPILAFAALGAVVTFVRRESPPALLWAILMAVGSIGLYLATSISWNPRYFVFFLPAVWMLAAEGIADVSRRLVSPLLNLTWFGAVALLLAPSLLSHYQDGSRHDYRQAATVLMDTATGDQPVLSDDAETISYYLPPGIRSRLFVRTKITQYPAGEFFLVCRMNAWTPQPVIAGRHVELLAEISRRRFDQFSHILRVYRIARDSR